MKGIFRAQERGGGGGGGGTNHSKEDLRKGKDSLLGRHKGGRRFLTRVTPRSLSTGKVCTGGEASKGG